MIVYFLLRFFATIEVHYLKGMDETMLALDHIVITSANIEDASEQCKINYSIDYVQGGKHTHWGTYNYLAHLSNDCYIEWLGIYDHVVATKSDNPLIVHLRYMLANNLSGPFQFALRTSNINKYVNHFKNNDIPFIGPVDGRRTTPDGESLMWRMLFPTYDATNEMLPFLIEWIQADNNPTVNEQQIKTLQYSGLTSRDFGHIYHLNQDEFYCHTILLENCQIQFTDNKNKLLGFTF